MTYSDAVKYIRTKSALSQQAFAKTLGVSFASISRWENGLQTPSPLASKVFCDYCNAHGLEVLIENGEVRFIGQYVK